MTILGFTFSRLYKYKKMQPSSLYSRDIKRRKYNMKHEWKKSEKNIYLPKSRPEKISIPEFKFFMISGEGNPNDEFFAEYIGVLYSLTYAVKMSPKSGKTPKNYFEYTVYPLEGEWDINDEAKKKYNGKLDKNALIFDLMIRQPDFVTADLASEMIEKTKKKKPHELLDQVRYEVYKEGDCIQMLHIGSYDDEPQSFNLMKQFANEQNLKRISMKHREIYLSDARKTPPEKLKTVLRFQVK
jgi:hypothetical protein